MGWRLSSIGSPTQLLSPTAVDPNNARGPPMAGTRHPVLETHEPILGESAGRSLPRASVCHVPRLSLLLGFFRQHARATVDFVVEDLLARTYCLRLCFAIWWLRFLAWAGDGGQVGGVGLFVLVGVHWFCFTLRGFRTCNWLLVLEIQGFLSCKPRTLIS